MLLPYSSVLLFFLQFCGAKLLLFSDICKRLTKKISIFLVFFGNSTISKIFSFLFKVPNDGTISSFPLTRVGHNYYLFLYYYSFSIHFRDHLASILNVSVGFLSLFYLFLFSFDFVLIGFLSLLYPYYVLIMSLLFPTFVLFPISACSFLPTCSFFHTAYSFFKLHHSPACSFFDFMYTYNKSNNIFRHCCL